MSFASFIWSAVNKLCLASSSSLALAVSTRSVYLPIASPSIEPPSAVALLPRISFCSNLNSSSVLFAFSTPSFSHSKEEPAASPFSVEEVASAASCLNNFNKSAAHLDLFPVSSKYLIISS